MLERLIAEARAVGERAEVELTGLGEDAAARRCVDLLAEAGLLAWTVPAAFGGADAGELAGADEVSVRALCALRAELAAHSGILDVTFVMQGLGSYPLARAGSDELRARVMGVVARGERVAAFAVTEHGAGSSLGEVATKAVQTDGGWRLDGGKAFITNAGVADFFTLLARTGGEPGDGGQDGLTMFLVPADAPGLTVERFEVTAPHPIGDLSLDGVVVADDARLGDLGGGLALALATLARFRTSVAAAATGFARRALSESTAHLRSREQFGRPLATFQALRFELAEMDTRLEAARLLVEAAASAVDEGGPATAEVARAKLYATETASWICDRAVQHHGGLGVRRGTVVERLLREARALRIYEGTSEIQKLILAKELLSSSDA
ncbi:MAG: acyl-CoA dehydrogenase family protein [Planctomycetota bacterium]|jgi:acyl-CoA dehydrogenase|nr:acyl-CoA dehydrogenase family protein [Planctomycetota bacterium]MDP6763212.1 acyl-CoA dehydrogenase family protein [Planctomycetota bacterium]MDP6990579.1 acyl-CoA dehydrogenase family protein [Planctomycetota bacterium]